MPHKPETANLWRGLALLIEDNPVIRVLTVRHMEQKRFNVLQAESGDPAIEIALMQHPDALRMDKEMLMNAGAEAARRYWRSPRTSGKLNVRARWWPAATLFSINPRHART